MLAFIDCNKEQYGVEPICKVLPIAPPTYYHYKTLNQQPGRRRARAKRDEQLKREIQRTGEASHCNYGAREVWKQFNRKLTLVACCTAERLMKQLGL